MLTNIKKRLGREEDEGFTLIELMVVVLIIAILLAIAIPTFLGARNSANARAGQSNVRNALTAEQTYYTNNQSFSAYIPDLTAVEPNLGWTNVEPAAKGGSAVMVGAFLSTTAAGGAVDSAAQPDQNEAAVVLQSYSQDGNCYTILQANALVAAVPAGTYYNASTGACTMPTLPTYNTTNFPGTGKASSNLGAKWYPSW